MISRSEKFVQQPNKSECTNSDKAPAFRRRKPPNVDYERNQDVGEDSHLKETNECLSEDAQKSDVLPKKQSNQNSKYEAGDNLCCKTHSVCSSGRQK